MVRYPHTLTIMPGAAMQKDDNGDYEVSTPAATETMYKCRAESYDSNGIVNGADGEVIRFNWTVYMPLNNVVIPVDTIVSIDANGVQINDTVKRYSIGQMNNRLWL